MAWTTTASSQADAAPVVEGHEYGHEEIAWPLLRFDDIMIASILDTDLYKLTSACVLRVLS